MDQGEALFLDDENGPVFQFQGEPEPKWMTFPCQGAHKGSSMRCMIALRPHQKNGKGASWEWNGDREHPTISPSVNCEGCWHGHIKAGEFVP